MDTSRGSTSSPTTAPYHPTQPLLLYPVNKFPHSQLPVQQRISNFFFIATAQHHQELFDVISQTIPLPTTEFVYQFLHGNKKHYSSPIQTIDKFRALGFLCENIAKFCIEYDSPHHFNPIDATETDKTIENNLIASIPPGISSSLTNSLKSTHSDLPRTQSLPPVDQHTLLFSLAIFATHLISDPHTAHCLFTSSCTIDMASMDDEEQDGEMSLEFDTELETNDLLLSLSRAIISPHSTLAQYNVIKAFTSAIPDTPLPQLTQSILSTSPQTSYISSHPSSYSKTNHISHSMRNFYERSEAVNPNAYKDIDRQYLTRIKSLRSTQLRLTPIIQLVTALYSVLTNHLDDPLLLGSIVPFFSTLFQPFLLVQPDFTTFPYTYRSKTTGLIVFSTGNQNCDEFSYSDEQLLLLSHVLNLALLTTIMEIISKHPSHRVLIEHCIHFIIVIDKFVSAISTNTLQLTSLIITWPHSVLHKEYEDHQLQIQKRLMGWDQDQQKKERKEKIAFQREKKKKKKKKKKK